MKHRRISAIFLLFVLLISIGVGIYSFIEANRTLNTISLSLFLLSAFGTWVVHKDLSQDIDEKHQVDNEMKEKDEIETAEEQNKAE